MRAIAWCSAILTASLALGLLTSRAEEKPAPAPASNLAPALAASPVNPPPPFLSEEGKRKFLSVPPLPSAKPSVGAATDVATGKLIPSSVSPEISSVIKLAFPYAPPAPSTEAAAGAAAPDSDVVEMKPFHVTGTLEGADRAMGEKERKVKDEAFTFKDGGTIMKLGNRIELKFKYNPLHKGWDILDIPW